MSNEPITHRFDTPEPTHLYVENSSGQITIAASERGTTDVRVSGRRAEEVQVTHDGDRVAVIAPKSRGGNRHSSDLDIEVDLPEGGEVVVRSGSADLVATGMLGATKVKSGSGEVSLDHLGGPSVVDTGSGDVRLRYAAHEVRVRSGSGDVDITHVEGSATVSTGSGDVHIARADQPVVVKTGSGDLVVDRAEADVAWNTGSGDIVLREARRGRVTAKAASGDVSVGVRAGTPVWTDITSVSGHVSSSLPRVGEPEPGADHVELRISTASGDIALEPARPTF